jgi:DNA modification methylase
MLAGMSHSEVLAWWKRYCETHGYSYEKHLEFCKILESKGHLPSAMMLFPPHSNNPDIWTDIMRIDTLNTNLSMKSEQNHVCPLQKSVCSRLIERYTNEGDTVLDPFGGVMTVPYVSIKMKRKGVGIELNPQYWQYGVAFCERAEQDLLAPTLFDLADELIET